MGKALMIAVVGFMFAGAYFAFGDKQAQYETHAQQAEDEFGILARNAALMGVDKAEQLLAEDFRNYNKNDLSGTYEGGAYEAKATRHGSKRIVVRSTGTTQTGQGKTVTFNIRAEYERKPWPRIASDPPGFMQYQLIAGGNLSISGTPNAYAFTPGDGSTAPPNADMHANGLLSVDGNSTSVEGFGTYTMGANPDQEWVAGAFTPNVNPTESDHAYQTAAITLPNLDPAAMAASLVADSVTTESVSIAGPADLPPLLSTGTREDPFVWHIQGNLTFSGAVSMTGYAIFLVDNNVTFDENVTAPQTNFEGEDESTLAFYVGSVAHLSGNTEVWGQIFANDATVSASGTPTLYGNLVTKGNISFSGTPGFYYRRASPGLTTYWQGGANDRLERITYSEW